MSFEDLFESSRSEDLIAHDESLLAFLDYFLNLMTNTATCLSQLGLSLPVWSPIKSLTLEMTGDPY